MRLFPITNGFDQMTDAYLIVRANTIKAGVAANPDSFPTPSPSLTDLGGTITAFSAAVQAAEGGDRQAVAEKNAVRQTLVNQLHLLGNYVLFMAQGNEVVATSSNFRISRVAQPLPPLTNPDGLLLKNGRNSGELELSCRAVKGAKAYMYEIAATPVTDATVWERLPGTGTKFLYEGLESGKEYACRVAAIGPRKQLVFSGVVTRMAV